MKVRKNRTFGEHKVPRYPLRLRTAGVPSSNLGRTIKKEKVKKSAKTMNSHQERTSDVFAVVYTKKLLLTQR